MDNDGGLSSLNPGKRAAAAMLNFTPTIEQVERGLSDDKPYVRVLWVKRQDYPPTREQVERGLNDPHGDVRLAWAVRTDYTPLKTDYINGLKSRNNHVRAAWAGRVPEGYDIDETELVPCVNSVGVRRTIASIPWLNKQDYVHRWMTDEDALIRIICASKKSVDISPFIDLMLCDKNPKVRKIAALRNDYTPNSRQAEMGIQDKNPNVASIWVKRSDYEVTPDMIERGLSHRNSIFRSRWMSKVMMLQDAELRDVDTYIPTL